MNHVDKYYEIINHKGLPKAFGSQAKVELNPQMVNPLNETIETDTDKVHLNTAQRWWVEVSYLDADFESVHDWDLDCGGETAEDAINNLYDLVVDKFGEPK